MTTELLAWQHIYASVEREQSPHSREGFQTLFYSRSGLTEAEVKEMEARLVYFPSDIEPAKRVFTTISTGKIMVAQIVHLPEPDRLGRKGRYLAHNLVFEPEAFERLDSDPFLVFRQFSFITTVGKALEEGNLHTGDISPTSLEITLDPAHEVEAANVWPAQGLKELALLALRADQLAGDRLGVAFIGTPYEVESALEAAFLAVPAPLRPRCSFDTYFYRCNPVDTYYWALGLLEPPGNRRLITVNARSRHLDGVAASRPETAYERWAMSLLETGQLETLARNRNQAFAIGEWLEGRLYTDSSIGAAPPEVAASVFQLSRELVHTLLHRELEAKLPPILARRVFRHLVSQAVEGELIDQLRTGFQLPELTETLYRAYESHELSPPQQEEIEAIAWLLQRADHAFLRLLHLCWTDRRDELYVELQLLGRDEYRQFAQTALHSSIVEPWALPVPGKGDAFLDAYLVPGSPVRHSLVAVVQALLGVGEASCLARLTPYVQAQPEPDLRALEEVIAKQPGIPDRFHHAVSDAVAGLPPKRRGFLARLLDHRGS